MKTLKKTIITILVINLATFSMALSQTESKERAKAAKQAVEAEREKAEAMKQEQKEIEAAMRIAKDNLEKAKAKLDKEKVKLMAKLEALGDERPGYGVGMGMGGYGGGGYGGVIGGMGDYGTILLVPIEQIEPEKFSTITEDLNVMARIFDKNIEPQGGNRRWQSWPFQRDDESTRSIYIQGYGVLFLTKVDFPLAPPPEIQVEKADSGTDPVWQKTKQEMYPSQIGVKGGGTTIVSNQYGTSYLVSKHTSMATDYDPDRVDELKRKLLRLLRHATNIRNINDQEWITLAVTGASQPVIIKQVIVTSDKAESVPIIQKTSNASSVLTIRVKKADVDAFAQDKLDFDKFREKAEIITMRVNPQQQTLSTGAEFEEGLEF